MKMSSPGSGGWSRTRGRALEDGPRTAPQHTTLNSDVINSRDVIKKPCNVTKHTTLNNDVNNSRDVIKKPCNVTKITNASSNLLSDVTSTPHHFTSIYDRINESDVTRISFDRITNHDVTTMASARLYDCDVTKTSHDRVTRYDDTDDGDVKDIPKAPHGHRPHDECGQWTVPGIRRHSSFNCPLNGDSCCCNQLGTVDKSGIIIGRCSDTNTKTNRIKSSPHCINDRTRTNHSSSPDTLTVTFPDTPTVTFPDTPTARSPDSPRREPARGGGADGNFPAAKPLQPIRALHVGANNNNNNNNNSPGRSPFIVSRLKLDPRPRPSLLLLLLLLLACSSSSSTARGPFAEAHCEKDVKFFNDQLGVCEPCSECRRPYITIIPCYEYQDTTCAMPGDYFEVKGRDSSKGTTTAAREQGRQGGQDGTTGRRRGGDVGGEGRNRGENRGRKQRNRGRNKGRNRGGGMNRNNNRNRGNRKRTNERFENSNYLGSEENHIEEVARSHQDNEEDYYLGREDQSSSRNGADMRESFEGGIDAHQRDWQVSSTKAPRRHSGGRQSAQAENSSLSASPKRPDFSDSPPPSTIVNTTEDTIPVGNVHETNIQKPNDIHGANVGAVSGVHENNLHEVSAAPAPVNSSSVPVVTDSTASELPPSSTTEDASLRLSLREMVSSGWTAAVVVCAALLLGLLAVALLLLLGLHLLILFKNKIVTHLKENRSEEGSGDGSDHAYPSSAVLMHQTPSSSLSSSPSHRGKQPKKPKKLGRGLGRVPSGKVLVARTYKPAPGGRGDKLDSSNSSSSGCAMRQSTSTVLTSADTFLSGGSDGTFCAETRLMSETIGGRHDDLNTSAKETSFSFGGKDIGFSSDRGKESSFGVVSSKGTPSVDSRGRWTSRSSSTPNTASLWPAKQNDKLLAATLPLVGGGHANHPAPMHVVNSVVTNNIVTFGDGSTVSTTTNYSPNATDGDSNLNYPYAHTLPTTYIRTSTRTPALLNNNISTFNGASHGNAAPSSNLVSGSPHPAGEPLQTITNVPEAKGSPIPYTMDKLLEQRRRLGCTSSVDTNIYVEMWRGSSAAPSNAPSAAPSPALHRSTNIASNGGRGSTFTPSTGGGPLDRSPHHANDDQRTAFMTAVQRDLNNLNILSSNNSSYNTNNLPNPNVLSNNSSYNVPNPNVLLNNSSYNSNNLANANVGLNDVNGGGDRVASAGGGALGNGAPLISIGRSTTNSPALQRHPALGGGIHTVVGSKHGVVTGHHTIGNTPHVLANSVNHAVGSGSPVFGGNGIGGASGAGSSVHAGRVNGRLGSHLNNSGVMPASPGPAVRHFR